MFYGVKNNKHLKVQCQNWPTFGYYVVSLLDFNGSVFNIIILIKITLLVSAVKNSSTPYTVGMYLWTQKLNYFQVSVSVLMQVFFEAEGIPYKCRQHAAGASIMLKEPMSGKNTLLCNSLE